MRWTEDEYSFDVGKVEGFVCVCCGWTGVGVAGVRCDDDSGVGYGEGTVGWRKG